MVVAYPHQSYFLLALLIVCVQIDCGRCQEEVTTEVAISGRLGTIGEIGEGYAVGLISPVSSRNASFWHDIPFHLDGTVLGEYAFVCEIPKDSCSKMEVMPERLGNPIQQDDKYDLPRYFRRGTSPFNYGMIPQTWESPFVADGITGICGDRDPIDVVDISEKACERGSVTRIKVLGALAMIDDNETDWKVIAISQHDPRASSLQNLGDLSDADLNVVLDWFKTYKSINCLKARDNWINNTDFHEELVAEIQRLGGENVPCASLYNNYSLLETNPTLCSVEKSNVNFYVVNNTAGEDDIRQRYFIDRVNTIDVIHATHTNWIDLVASEFSELQPKEWEGKAFDFQVPPKELTNDASGYNGMYALDSVTP